MKITRGALRVLPCCIMPVWLLCPLAFAAVEGAAQPAANGEPKMDRARLQDRRFQVSWTSAEGGAVNGNAWLKPDGSIHGINSPNETTWLVDASGRLLFEHADGRVSTRFDKVELVDGLLRFEGPFLFREGITHHLIEVGSTESESAGGRGVSPHY